MKKLLSLVVMAATLSTSWAQLPNGSVAPDFTMTDIYGESHNLYSYLDQGMSVILNFSAVWCGPCLAYKEEGILNDIYNAYGPDGSGDIMVLSFETEDQLGTEALYGEGQGTLGDFVTGTNYPIIDNASDLYWLSYNPPGTTESAVPLIYTVCPNRILTLTGQAPLATHVTAATMSCGNAVTSPAATVNYSGDEYKCGDGSWEAKGDLTNLGSIPVTSAQFEVDFNGNVSTVNWSGNLNSGATATADLGSYAYTGNFSAVLTQLNGEPRNAGMSAEIEGSTWSTDMLIVKITPDCWPEETSWEIKNENGAVIESAQLAGSIPGQEVTWQVDMPSYGCYTFHLIDSYGDGLNGCQWTGDNCTICGEAAVWSYNGTEQVSTIVNFEGAANDSDVAYNELIRSFEVNSTSTDIDELGLEESLEVFPNPTAGEAQVVYTLGQSSDVTVEVTNALGQRVELRQLGSLPAGEHRTTFDLSGLTAGMYNVVLRADDRVSTLRITKQ